MYSLIVASIVLTSSIGHIISDSGDEKATVGCPKPSQTAASKVTDPSNGSTTVLTSHQDAAAAAKLVAAAAVAGVGPSYRSLSTVVSTSNSCSVSPGKRNADEASLTSKSRSESEAGKTSAQGRHKGKERERGTITRESQFL